MIALSKKDFFLIILLAGLLFNLANILNREVGKEEFRDRSETSIPENTDKVLFFYRDDCPDCESIFKQVYLHDVLEKDVIFINTNNPANRKEAIKRRVKTVPSFIRKKQFYEGTEREKIKEILEESK